MRINVLAMVAAMALPFVRRRSPEDLAATYRSSRDTTARTLRREDQRLMGGRWY
jgi:hypothetical protein